MSNTHQKKYLKIIVALSVFVAFIIATPQSAYGAVTYNFNSDTIGQTPSNTTVTAGTFDVQDEVTLGKSIRAVTQVGVIAGINFDSFASSTDYSVVWKQAYSNSLGRGGFTLRSQTADTGVANSAGAKMGYLFHVYDSNALYIWKVGSSSYTPLWSGSLTKAQPRWFKAIVFGNQLAFYYSNDGTSFTHLATTTDSTYASGFVQYTSGYGAAVNRDYVDDVVITSLVSDVTSPTVNSFSPADNAAAVGVDGTFQISFNEDVATTSVGSIVLKKASDDSIIETISSTSSKITASGTSSFIINPLTTLESETQYYFQIDSTSIEDLAGNDFAGISATSTWNFTTADVQAPTVSDLSPADGAIDVLLNSNLSLILSEVVTIGTGNISIYKSFDDSLLEAIDVTGGQVSGNGSTTITINPSNDFSYGTSYYIQITSTTLGDASGNAYAGISATSTWNFTTMQAPAVAVAAVQQAGPTAVSAPSLSQAEIYKIFGYRNVVQKNVQSNADGTGTLFVRQMDKGVIGDDVLKLQKFLNENGFPVAPAGQSGSKGKETNFFGPATRRALVNFQDKYVNEILKPVGLKKGTGTFGDSTKKFVNTLLSKSQ